MLKIEHTEVMGWEAAIRGMRNPLNSWNQSDSKLCKGGINFDDCRVYAPNGCPRDDFSGDIFCVGENDYDLMKRLRNAGTDHRKFMRMLTVYCDITAPLYWWKEYDTYKIGTVANSCSTMHKIHAKEFTLDDFSHEHLNALSKEYLMSVIYRLNESRNNYLDSKEKAEWWQMIQLLPSSYNQKRTVMLNYEVLANIYRSRRHHKLDEWRTLCDWIEELPYSELITGERKGDNDGV